MKYKIKEFIEFLGIERGTYHIYVKIDDTKKYKVVGIPARKINFVQNGDGRAQLYISVNPCRMMTGKPKISDVTHWTCEYIDLDCERPDHSIPATDVELDNLDVEIERINNWLEIEGFHPGYCDFTGNGYRWLLPVPSLDLHKMGVKDVKKLNEQKKEFLRIIKRETDTNIDTAVGELSRITGIPGTINVKARDERDRRRGPFRGSERIEDAGLQNYIMSIEIPEDEYAVEEREFHGAASDIVEALMMKDRGFNTMIQKATLLKKGHRSGHDYAIARKLRDSGVGIRDCMDILRGYGTTKAKSKDYVELTARKVYLG